MSVNGNCCKSRNICGRLTHGVIVRLTAGAWPGADSVKEHANKELAAQCWLGCPWGATVDLEAVLVLGHTLNQASRSRVGSEPGCSVSIRLGYTCSPRSRGSSRGSMACAGLAAGDKVGLSGWVLVRDPLGFGLRCALASVFVDSDTKTLEGDSRIVEQIWAAPLDVPRNCVYFRFLPNSQHDAMKQREN